MGYCWAVGCNHHNQREKCKFFTLPKDTKTRNKWLKLLRRSDQPGRGCVVCSCHFKNGLRINGPELQEHLKKAFNNDFPPPSKKIQSIKKITIPSIPIDMPSCETNTQNALDVDSILSKSEVCKSVICHGILVQFFNFCGGCSPHAYYAHEYKS